MFCYYRPRHASSTIEAIVNEATKVKVVLPNVIKLRESLENARDWSDKVDKIQVIFQSNSIIVSFYHSRNNLVPPVFLGIGLVLTPFL